MKDREQLERNVAISVILVSVLSLILFFSNMIASPTGFTVYNESTTFEAEDLTLVGAYTISTSCACSNTSNGECIKNIWGGDGCGDDDDDDCDDDDGNGGDNYGSVIYDFDLDDGLYDIAMKHCPENDGNDTYKLYVNNGLVEIFAETSDTQVWEEHIFDNVLLSSGDEVKIKCIKSDDSTHCRIDQIIFNKITVNETILPIVHLISPADNSTDTDGNIIFTYNVTDDSNISNCELIINNIVTQTDYSITKNIPQTFNQALSNGSYTWQVNCTDQYNNQGYSEIWNLEVAISINDTVSPIVTLISPANNSIDTDGFVTFYYNVTDDSNINNCELVIDNNVVKTDYSITKDIPQSFTYTLANGTHNWYVNCTDQYNNKGQSQTWIININLTLIEGNETACCCGLSVSTTPEVAGQGDKILIAADVSNLFTGLAATPANIIDLNVTIYRIENSTDTMIVNNLPMTYLAGGLWYYEFYVGNNATGTYVASVTMLTNQTFPFIKEASDSFTIGERISGLSIMGVSADLINLNETARLAAEIKYNGIAVDESLITNASVIIQQLNGTIQMYTLNDSLQVDDGIIYVDGAFNATGVYYLDWSATYHGEGRTAREIMVVVGWEDILEDINYTINVELVSLIKENRQYLLELLTDMEYLQEFTEEEIFLITDSVNSMTKVIGYLEDGAVTDDEARQQINQITGELEERLGISITGSAITQPVFTKTPFTEKLQDWRVILFGILLFMLMAIMATFLLLVRVLQTGAIGAAYQKLPLKQTKPVVTKRSDKRRYEIFIDQVKNRLHAKKQEKQKQVKTSKKRRYILLLEKVKQSIKQRKEKRQKSMKVQPERRHLVFLKKIKNSLKVKSKEHYLHFLGKIKKSVQQKKEKVPEEINSSDVDKILSIDKSTVLMGEKEEIIIPPKMPKQKKRIPAKKNMHIKCLPGKEFILNDGSTISSLKELQIKIQNLDQSIFNYHVNAKKNDFSNWIRDVFGYHELAQKVASATNSKEIVSILQDFLK